MPVELSFSYAHRLDIYDEFLTSELPAAFAAVSEDEIASARKFYDDGATDAYIEGCEISRAAGTALLPFGRAVFHGAAFVWRQKAWIFAAPSGTGKTTQYRLWKLLFGDEIQMLCGDKPVIEIEHGGTTVFSSPWRGKENSIRRLLPREAAGRIYLQFMFSRKTKEQLLAVCSLEHRLLSTVPVWLLKNRGDEASAMLCRETIEKELYADEI